MPEDINDDITEKCDYNYLKNSIKAILRRHLPTDDNGDLNDEFDEYYTAEDAISDIYDIVGGI